MLHRRTFVFSAPLLGLPAGALAHHGWSSFDQARPVYLEGRAANVVWRNPHVEFDLDVAPDLKLPADLAQRAVPAQSAPVDGAGLLKGAQLPTRRDKRWHIELAPISRVEAWKVPPLKNGDAVSMLGFTFAGEKGDAVLRVEYLFLDGKTYGMRSSPA
jgi:Family of unknown function (DUF6152)